MIIFYEGKIVILKSKKFNFLRAKFNKSAQYLKLIIDGYNVAK